MLPLLNCVREKPLIHEMHQGEGSAKIRYLIIIPPRDPKEQAGAPIAFFIVKELTGNDRQQEGGLITRPG